jgi:RHS repeat-associated protein
MRRTALYCLVLAAVLMLMICPVQGQETANQAIALPMNGTFQGSDIETVQLNNGNLHIEIPLYSLSGRGPGVAVRYVYDSKGWYEYTFNFVEDTPVSVNEQGDGQHGNLAIAPFNNMRWTVAAPLANGFAVGFKPTTAVCLLNGAPANATVLKYTYKEPNGTSHNFFPIQGSAAYQNPCNSPVYGSTVATDGSGYTLFVNQTGYIATLYAKNGTHFFTTNDVNGHVNAVVMEDSNGNKLTRSVSNNIVSSTLVDTLGRNINTAPMLNATTGKYELKYYDSTDPQQQVIEITMTNVQVHTNVCPAQNTHSNGPCTEYTETWQAPAVIHFPNGMQYSMTYVQNSDGQISSLTLPTGATISYTWGSVAGNPQWSLDDAGPKVTSRTINSDGQSSTWSYTYSSSNSAPTQNTTTVTDPDGNDTKHFFAYEGDSSDTAAKNFEVETDYFNGSVAGTRIKTVTTAYRTTPVLPASVTTTWDAQGGLTSRTETDYYNGSQDATLYGWGNIKEEREYGFGISGSWGPLVRKSDYQYAHLSGNYGYNVNYKNVGNTGLVTEKTVYDGGGNKVADAKTSYDGAALTTTSGVINHDYSTGTYRGNATQSSVWLNTTNSWLPTNNAYNDLGRLLTTTDPGSHVTTYKYGDNWAPGAPLCGTAANAQGYLTEVDPPTTQNSNGNAVQHRTKTAFYPCTGLAQLTQDENNILAGSGTSYTYDNMLRPSCVNKTDGGQTCYTYSDNPGSISVTATTKIDNQGKNLVTVSYHDGLGRVKQTRQVDPEGDVYADTAYDLLGRVQCASNPYRNTSEATYGQTCFQYDALGRKTLEIPPDGTAGSNNVQTIYGGDSNTLALTTTVIDQATHAHKSYSDALGRLVRVDEPNPGTPSSPGTQSSGSVTVSGTIQSQPSQGTPGTGEVYISGSEQSYEKLICNQYNCDYTTYYDTGAVAITVNGHADSYSYGRNDTPWTIANGLASVINADSAAVVTAVAVWSSGSATIYLTAKTAGANTNYTLSASSASSVNPVTGQYLNSFQTNTFGAANLTGGTTGSGTLNDSGVVELTIGSFTVSAPYGTGGNSSSSAVANALAGTLNGSLGSPVTATVNGSTISLTSRDTGADANFLVTGYSASFMSQYFAAPSFSASDTQLTGGADGTGGDPTGLGIPAVTQYSYDTLGNLMCVVQKGGDTSTFTTCASAPATWRPRSFAYDSLSRLLTAYNPESGTITWTYDNDSNVITKLDAKGTTITYNYDALHRVATTTTPTLLHAKTYSNGDTPVDYFYDQSSYNGLTIWNPVNHQTGMADMTGASASTFDSEGRVTTENKTINIAGVTSSPVTKQLTYTYNLDGSNSSVIYPDGHTVTYTFNAAAHATSAVDSTNSSSPIKYVTSATYAPHGDVAGYLNGVTSGFAGIQTTNAWNNRFQPSIFTATTQGPGSQTISSLTFDFHLGVNDNGTLARIQNNGLMFVNGSIPESAFSKNFNYDQLNRIAAAWNDGDGVANDLADWGNQYSIDIWANMTAKLSCDGTACPLRHNTDAFSASANSKNQFNTYQYDASGNMQNDQLGHAFSYDAENRPYSAGGVTYYYDGVGERIAKSTGKLYFFGTGSAPVLETDAAGAITNEYVFFNGKRVAMLRASDSTVHYYFADQIGSAVKVTSADGSTVEQWIEYHPYGEETVITDTLGQMYRFTGKEHDPETNLDYFGARYYGSTFGRFLTPDWAATPVPIPYAQMGIPQTLNLYTYVQNNPITGVDPDGHDPVIGGILGAGAGAGYILFRTGQFYFTGKGRIPTPQETANAIKIGFAVGATFGAALGDMQDKKDAPSKPQSAPEPQTDKGQSSDKDNDSQSDKNVPNPDGKKGGAEHQQGVQEVEKDMQDRGLDTQREHRVDTPDGEKSKRFVDVVGKDSKGNVIEMHQVGKQNQNGQPVAREQRAINDIQKATGKTVQFDPYNKKKD